MMAKVYANTEIKRENKHLKAFLKGEKYYKIYGRVYPVVTKEILDQQEKMNETPPEKTKEEKLARLEELREEIKKLEEELIENE